MTTLGQGALPVSQLNLERQPSRCSPGEKTVDVKRWFTAQNVLGSGEYVVEVDRGNDPQSDFAIDAAEGQIVDFVAKGRDIGAFRRIELYYEDVIAIRPKVAGQLKRKRGEAAL